MNAKDVLSELEAMGTAQNRKVYARHGIRGPVYGVSFANLGKLRKRIGTDHDLALQLWKSGNHDARVLATMVADPGRFTAAALDAWAGELSDYVLADAFTALAARSPHAAGKMRKWTRSRREWVGATGWTLVSYLARDGALDPAEAAALLASIEARIHSGENRVRYAMNNAVIAIGLMSPGLKRAALAAAGRIGRVEVDHGETGCKTPDAAAYITRAAARKRDR